MRLKIVALDRIGADVVLLSLARPDGGMLPPWTPGAHVDVHLGNGLVRQYSLCGDPDDAFLWVIGVRRDANSRGGSEWIHDDARLGSEMDVSFSRNNFPLIQAKRYLFLAGGIGVTPFLSLCPEAVMSGADVHVALGGPSELLHAFLDRMRYADEMMVELYDADEGPLPLSDLLRDADVDTAVYCCGPPAMIAATRDLLAGRPEVALRIERFSPIPQEVLPNRHFTVELVRSGFEVSVNAEESVLDAVLARDVFVASSCREGTCGSCEVAVLAGDPEHRDSILDRDDPDRDATMMICVSRAHGDRLALDL